MSSRKTPEVDLLTSEEIKSEEITSLSNPPDAHVLGELTHTELQKVLEPEMTVTDLESLAFTALKEGASRKYLVAIVDAFIKEIKKAYSVTEFRTSSHSVCHLFEKYGKGPSILDLDDMELIKPLVEEALSKTISMRDAASVPRILSGLMTYALAHMDPEKMDEKLDFQPEGVSIEKLIPVLERNFPDARAFLTSKTKREFLTKLIESGSLKYYMDFSKPDQKMSFLKVIAQMEDVFKTKEEFNGIVDSMDSPKAIINVDVDLDSMEFCEGVYVDVDGTLLLPGSMYYLVNYDLVDELRALKDAGKKITIFTAGNPETAEILLKEYELGEDIFDYPVLSKDEFKGKCLEILFDDTAPQFQGFAAKTYFERTLKSG